MLSLKPVHIFDVSCEDGYNSDMASSYLGQNHALNKEFDLSQKGEIIASSLWLLVLDTQYCKKYTTKPLFYVYFSLNHFDSFHNRLSFPTS